MKVRLFDVCVLGQGIGGLVAALMLQRRGMKLVVLSRKLGDVPDPALSEFLCGFTLKPLLKRVGFHPTEVNAIPALEAPVQIIFPNARIDCVGDESRFQNELQREFSQKADKILQLFKESYGHLEIYQHLFNSRTPFPPRGFFAKREFAKLLPQICDPQLLEDRQLSDELKSFDVGEDFGQTIRAMELALTSLVMPWTSGAHLAHLLTLARWEGFATPRGVVDLRRMLVQKIIERGGIISECNDFSELVFDAKEIRGMHLKGGEWDEIRWEVAVVGGDPRGILSMVPDQGRFRRWRQQLDEVPIYAKKAFQVLRIASAGIPIGMKPQGLLMSSSRVNGNAERRERVRAIRYAIRWDEPTGDSEVRLAVTAFLPPTGDRPTPDQLGKEIRNQLKMVIPFLDQHLLDEPPLPHIPASEGGIAGDFSQRYIYTAEKPPILSICGLTPETPFNNVFQASDMIFPGLGLDGEILGGLQAAHWAGAGQGKQG